VVLLRVQGLNAQGQADLIRAVYVQCEGALSEIEARQRVADEKRQQEIERQQRAAMVP
jgi:hypothetical protein